MKISDGIKLGIGFYLGKHLYLATADVLATRLKPLMGKLQDKYYTEEDIACSKKKCTYYGTKYKENITNKKNPIGFV